MGYGNTGQAYGPAPITPSADGGIALPDGSSIAIGGVPLGTVIEELKNKTIDGDSNTVVNIDFDNMKSSVYDPVEKTITFPNNTGDNNIVIDENGSMTFVGDATITNILDVCKGFKTRTGFTNNRYLNMSFDDVNRELTITYDSFEIYNRGVRLFSGTTWESPALDAVITTPVFLYYNSNNSFVVSAAAWSSKECMIAKLYFDSNGDYLFGMREPHGADEDQDSHEEFHDRLGTYKYSSGAILGGIVEESSNPLDHDPTTSAVTIKDEGIKTDLSASLVGNYARLYFNSNSPVWEHTQSKIYKLSSGVPQVNTYSGNSFSIGNASNDVYITFWQFAIPVLSDAKSQRFKHVWLMPQWESTSLNDELAFTADKLLFGPLSAVVPEFIFINRMIFHWKDNVLTFKKSSQISVNNKYNNNSDLSVSSIPYEYTDAWKAPCKVAIDTAINVLNPGFTAYNGVSLSVGDRVCIISNNDSKNLGVWVFNGENIGLSRPLDFDVWSKIAGARIPIASGFYSGYVFVQNVLTGTLGVTNLSITDSDSNKVVKFNFGNGSSKNVTVTHNWKTRDISVVKIRNIAPYDEVVVETTFPTIDTCFLTWGTYTPSTDEFRIILRKL